ncbi:MAG TPA: hypothetical protein VLH56_18845 [Dissulfurispiraceae bacterium]|nr:hypothetical protein [Dissulfurispiraceae bacterium]
MTMCIWGAFVCSQHGLRHLDLLKTVSRAQASTSGLPLFAIDEVPNCHNNVNAPQTSHSIGVEVPEIFLELL